MDRIGTHVRLSIGALATAMFAVTAAPVIVASSQPAAAATPSPGVAVDGVGPSFGTVGTVRAPFRDTSTSAAYAAVHVDTRVAVVAGTADGDFALTRDVAWANDGFGVDTKVTTDFGAPDDTAYGLALAPDGHVIAVGSSGGNVAVGYYDAMGRLDWSFDGNGQLVRDLGGTDDAAYGVVALPSGSFLVAGGNRSSGTVLDVRPDGTLDGTFGSGGLVTRAAAGPWRAIGRATDGGILVAGGGAGLTVAKLSLPNGAPDPAFGTGGIATLLAGPGAVANALAVQPDGRILLAGTSGGDAVVVRLLPTGAADPTFGVGGVARLDQGGNEAAYAVAVLDDGHVLAAGDGSGGRAFVSRYQATGVPDLDFGTAGVAMSETNAEAHYRAIAPWFSSDPTWIAVGFSADQFVDGHFWAAPTIRNGAISFAGPLQLVHGLAVQRDGKVLVAGEVGGDIGIVRFNQDGTRDPTFGRAGQVQTDAGSWGKRVVVETGGRIVVAATDAYSHAALVGFQPSGAIDTSFGTGGRVSFPAASDVGFPEDLVVQPDGKLLLSAGGNGGAVLARFTAEGQLDPTFGTGGVLRGALGDTTSRWPASLAVQPDGRILATGQDFTVRRLLPDGSHDVAFGINGTVQFDYQLEIGSMFDSALAVLPDSKILVGGANQGGCGSAVAFRLNPDGSRDAGWQRTVFSTDAGEGHCNVPSAIDHFGVLPDGRVYGFGTSLVRYLSDGSPDPTLGIGGLLAETGVGNPTGGLVLTPDGNVLTAGSALDFPGPGGGFALGRVLTGAAWAPQAVSATPLAGAARVFWSPPPGLAPRPLVAYVVTASDGAHTARTRGAGDLTAVVKGLKDGVTYTFTVQAVTPSGNGPASAPSNSMTPSTTAPFSAWGWNGVGQVGDGTTVDRHAPTTVAGLTGVVSVAGGLYHSLALRNDGTVWAWGWNGIGQLGDGTTTDHATPVRVLGLTDVVGIAAGMYHSLAVKADGTVWAWGWNGSGQLGDGTTVDRHAPVRVVGLAGMRTVSAGAVHSLGVRADGTIWAWGWNGVGQLGDGTTIERHLPVEVVGLPAMSSVTAGWHHSMAIAADGHVWAWGWNALGQLGTGNLVDAHVPVRSQITYRVTALAAGLFHTVALVDDGHLLGWGWNGEGEIGLGEDQIVYGTGVINPPGPVASVAAGAFHTAAVLDDGSVWVWGWNDYGQAGNGTTARATLPVQASGTGFATTVAGGGIHTLAA